MAKKIIFLLLAALFITAISYVIVQSEKLSLLVSFVPEKIAVFKNVHMSGVEGSTEAWEVYADEGWTAKDKFTTTLDHVTNAILKRDDRLLIKGLRARRMRISKNKDIEVLKKVDDDKGGSGYLRVMIDFGALSNPPKKEAKFSFLAADCIRFNPDSKKGSVQGNITLTKDKLDIHSDRISMDLNNNIATFETRSSFIKEGSSLLSDSAIAFFDEGTIDMSGSVEVMQKNKKAHSDSATYDDNTRTIVMTSNVNALIEKPKSLIKEETSNKYEDEESKKALMARTTITCKKLVINTDNNDCTAYGDVYVMQKENEAKSDQADYSEKTEKIVMTGNVYMKQKEDWVKADKVIVSIDREMFEAIGGVETTFKVKKGSR